MANKVDEVHDWTWQASKVLVLGEDGKNYASTTNPLPVDMSSTANNFSITVLDGVTEDTTSSSIDIKKYKSKTVFINVSVNTGAVTVKIQVSPDGTNWFDLDLKTYTATTGTDIYSYETYYPFMRVLTTSQTDATVTVYVAGRGI